MVRPEFHRSTRSYRLHWKCFTAGEHLMLNVTNETAWTSPECRGACSSAGDRSPWIRTWREALCFCSVSAADAGWHNQVTDAVRALGYSLCSPPHYSAALFRRRAGRRALRPIRGSCPSLFLTHTHTHTKKITQATRGTKQGRGSSKQALETFQTKEKSAEIWSRRSFYLGCHYS